MQQMETEKVMEAEEHKDWKSRSILESARRNKVKNT